MSVSSVSSVPGASTRFNGPMPTTSPGDRSREQRRDALRNQEGLLKAATVAVHRDGLQVPMGRIAADAGVGPGTLYRHFPNREALLAELTHRSFERVLANVHAAEQAGTDPIECLRLFIDAAISQRNDLVLPLHGGPPITSPSTIAVRAEVHRAIKRILDRGVASGMIDGNVTPGDIITFGSMLAQPRHPDQPWDATCRRLLDGYLQGITASHASPARSAKRSG